MRVRLGEGPDVTFRHSAAHPEALSLGPGLCFVSEMEFDLDKALEEVPIHIEDPPLPSARQEKRSSGLISELPSEEGKKLEHFTKLRPKRNKKQQPTQAAVGGPRPPPPTPPDPGGARGTDPPHDPQARVSAGRSAVGEKITRSSAQGLGAELPLEEILRKVAGPGGSPVDSVQQPATSDADGGQGGAEELVCD